jgi:hypothetical protein
MRKFIQVAMILLLSAIPAYAIIMIGFGQSAGEAAVVQATGDYSNDSATTMVKAFTSNVTAGNTIVVFSRVSSGGGSITGVTDSLGNTYVERLASSTNRYKIYEASNITGGACTVTVAYATSGSARGIGIWEASGLINTGAYDVGAMAETSRTGVVATDGNYSDNVTTTANGDLIVAAAYNTGSAWVIAPGTGYEERVDLGSYFQTEDKIAGAAGSYNATWTPNSTSAYNWTIAAFKAAP